jgi:membrane-bound transcription factor site-1 protease
MKQALVEGATRIPGPNMFEQGQGKLDLLASKVCTTKSQMITESVLDTQCSQQSACPGCVPGRSLVCGVRSQDILAKYEPRASVVPAALNLTDCPYAWPFCRQPLYADAMPAIFNATVLNGMGLTGQHRVATVCC